MDKSFEGLLISVVLHILLFVFLWNAKFPHLPPREEKTEITLIDKPTNTKAKSFAIDNQEKKEIVRDAKDQADYLSQFTKRVKKQMRASKIGPTINAANQPNLQLTPQYTPQPPANQQENPEQHQPEEEGVGRPRAAEMSQPIRDVAFGQSSSEYIPGLQEGGFTSLNTDQFTFYAFFSRMHEQVKNRWVPLVRNFVGRQTQKELEDIVRHQRLTQIEIMLSPDGQFANAVLQASSGNRELDQTTIDAFRAAAPFPNPPRQMVEGDGFIHLHYQFYLL